MRRILGGRGGEILVEERTRLVFAKERQRVSSDDGPLRQG